MGHAHCGDAFVHDPHLHTLRQGGTLEATFACTGTPIYRYRRSSVGDPFYV